MEQFTYNETYLMRDGTPFFPVMGEFQYSRYPDRYWEEELCKIRAGGVDIISTYVFWNHHEEEKGVFDFSGQRSLGRFVELCKKCGLEVCLRIGPWVHGEARLGGFPDWLMRENCKPRTDDAAYLSFVRKYWEKVYEQVAAAGRLFAIQIENEYGHVGGCRGEAGERHMRTLTALAKEIGFRAAYWTATGWGGAVIGDLLPMMGGYCDATWVESKEKLPPNKNYLFTPVRNDGNIGADYGIGEELSFDRERYPYLTAELGGGLQAVQKRRPRVSAEDIGAMTVAKLGSGCNLLGYYVYHGGTNPKGKFTTLNESRQAGDFFDLPEYNYDFQAPIREFGQVSDTMKELKLLTMFVHDFGAGLCAMKPDFSGAEPAVSEDHSAAGAENGTDLSRYRRIIRRNGRQGYLFVNNYQRVYAMNRHEDVRLTAALEGEQITYPPRTIRDGDYFFYPFHFPLGDGELIWINQTPLCVLADRIWVFYGDQSLQFEEADRQKKRAETILALTKEAAKNVWRLLSDRDALYISRFPLVEMAGRKEVWMRSGCREEEIFRIAVEARPDWEELSEYPEFMQVCEGIGNICVQRRVLPAPKDFAFCQSREISRNEDYAEYELSVAYEREPDAALEDVFLRISYEADSAQLWIDGEKQADQFFTGEVWEIGLKRYSFPQRLMLRLYPLHRTQDIYLETDVAFDADGVCCRLMGVETVTEQRRML